MESYLNSFKGELMQSVWQQGKRMFKPTIVIGLLVFVISGVLSFFFFSSTLGWDANFINELMSGDVMERQQLMQERMESIMADPTSIIRSFSLFFIIIMLIQSFVMTLMLKMSGNVANGEGGSMSLAFSKVTFRHVLLVILFFIVIFAVYMALVMIMSLLVSATHPLVAIVLLPLIVLTLLRFSNTVPAMVLGDKKFGVALNFSWTTITYIRALYIFVASIFVGLLGLLLMMLVSYILGLLGGIGIGLMVVFQAAVNIMLLALTISFYTAIYYRYAIVEGDDTQVESIGTE